MKTGKESFDQSLLDSLEKKYQLFLDSPDGEINVYLVLSKNDEDKSDFSNKASIKSSNLVNNFSRDSNVLKQNKSFRNVPVFNNSNTGIINN